MTTALDPGIFSMISATHLKSVVETICCQILLQYTCLKGAKGSSDSCYQGALKEL